MYFCFQCLNMFYINKVGLFLCFILTFAELGYTQISKQKCIEYENIKCSNHTRSKRIVGGITVDEVFKYPHQALIGYEEGKWLCGGILISEQWVLTAGQCLNSREYGRPKYVDVGFINKENRNEFGTLQSFTIIEIKKHPNYSPQKIYDDIALLKLDRPTILSKSVLPACLHDEFNIPVSKAVVTGWGVTSLDNNIPDKLMEVKIPTVDINTCKKEYEPTRRLPEGIINEKQICAGEVNKDTCQGDSGGPLQIVKENSCIHSIIGITSFGKGCGTSPAVYTRVSHYVSWIENIVWPK